MSTSVVTYDEVAGEVVTTENRRWECFLSQTLIEVNRNCWFKMKLVCRQKNEYVVIWQGGRTGVNARIAQRVFKDDIEKAKKLFCRTFYEKTKNDFLSDKFNYVQHMYNIFSSKEVQQGSAKTRGNGDNYFLEFANLDVKYILCGLLSNRCDSFSSKDLVPFPNLSKDHLEAACESLEKINTILTSNTTPDDDELNRLSNQFYMKVPHKTSNAVKITSADMLMAKSELLLKFDESGALQDSICQKLLSTQIDNYFLSLKVEASTVPRDSAEFKAIELALQSTHGPTHRYFKVELLDIIRIHREDEAVEENQESDETSRRRASGSSGLTSVSDTVDSSISQQESSTDDTATANNNGVLGNLFSDKRMLWHGSSIHNFNGILRNGLKIAPPNVPVHGYMFGKGLYFASASSKAAQYCSPNTNNIGLLSLCKVELGQSKVLRTANHDAPKLLGNEFQSIIGRGFFHTTGLIEMDNFNNTIFAGPLAPNYDPEALRMYNGLHYNEYVVYNEAQVKIKYLLRIKFVFIFESD